MKKMALMLVLFFSVQASAYVFEFKQLNGDQYRIVTTSFQNFFSDNTKVTSFDHGYKAVLRVTDVVNKTASIKGQYFYMAKVVGEEGAYKVMEDNIYESEFTRTPDGKMEVGQKFFYPVVRNLPVFPQKDIKIGEAWESTGIESQDFRKLGIPNPFLVPFEVRYQYLRDENYKGKDCAVISVFYYMNKRFRTGLAPYKKPKFPVNVKGFFKGLIYWDKKTGDMFTFEGNYEFIYIMSDGEIREWEGKDSGELTVIREAKEEEKKLHEDAKKEIGKVAEVKEDKEGLKLIFSDILFDFNKTNLKKEIIPTLEKVTELLKKYPKYEIRIEGHSDDVGQSEFKSLISENRAKSVANYFVKNGINNSRISYMGFSDRKPLVSGTSDKARAKNRRVEIYIITK